MSAARAATLTKPIVWEIDPAHTHVEFAVRDLMIANVRGRFSEVSGAATVPGADFTRAELEATIAVTSIDTREPQRDAHLKSRDFFDAQMYPTMTFKSRRIVRVPGHEDEYLVTGDLTLRGVTREVVLDATFGGQSRDRRGSDRAVFSATGMINLKDFGLTRNEARLLLLQCRSRRPPGRQSSIAGKGRPSQDVFGLLPRALESGGVLIGDEVKLSIDTQFVALPI